MKRIISKLALTLGLILMFGANAFAMKPVKNYSQNYQITCKVDGDDHDLNDEFGYTVKLHNQYSETGHGKDKVVIENDGVSTGNNDNPLTMAGKWDDKDKGRTLTELTNDNIDNYIVAISAEGYDVAITVGNNHDITIAYTSKGPTTYTVEYKGLTADEVGMFEYPTEFYDEEGESVSKTSIVTYTKINADNVASLITPASVEGYQAAISFSNKVITITYTKINTYDVTITGVSGGGFNVKGGATASGNTITVAAELGAGNVANYVEAITVYGYDAVVGFADGKVTVTYTKQDPKQQKYTVQCTVNGTRQNMDGVTYGYTIKQAYSEEHEGVGSAASAAELIMMKWGANPTKLDNNNINDYITAITSDDLGATITVNNTTITIAYQQLVTYTVTFENTPAGYGWDVKNGVTKIDDNHFKVAANITGQTWQNYITVVDLGGYQETVTINGTTITIGYAEAQEDEFTIGDLHYTVTKLAVKDGSAGTVSVRLVKDENGNVVAATDVTIPVSVTRGSFTYDVTEIEPFGFTTQYGDEGPIEYYDERNNHIDNRAKNDTMDKLIGTDFTAGKITAISLRLDNGYGIHTNCRNPGNRTHERGDDMDTKEDFGHNSVSLNGSTSNNTRYSYYFPGYNPNLKTVTIPEGSKITTIGANAFSGCWNLESFYVPFSVTSIGIGAFGGCISMSDFEFATGIVNGTPNRTQLTEIPRYMFIHCESLTTLRIPEGITTLGHRSTQYMLRLTKIELPSTLTTIEGEFLCTALSLKTLTIPAKVETIGASAFHGCEALEHVYFLGAPSALSMGSGGNITFGTNDGYCALAIHGCAFHVLPQYLYNTKAPEGEQSEFDKYHGAKEGAEGYKNAFNADNYDNTWGKVDGVNENYFTAEFPDVKKKYVPSKWVTFCMPESEIFFEIKDENGELANPTFVEYNEATKKKHTEGGGTDEGREGQEGVAVKARPAATTDASSGFLKYNFEYGWGDYDGFGPDCYVAEMIDVWQDPDTQNKSQLYHANFRCIDINQIQPNTPYLICPKIEEGKDSLDICLWTDNDLKRDAFIENMGEEAKHLVSLHTDDTKQTNVGTTRPAFVHMIGQINRGEKNPLLPGDIYFKSAGTGWTSDQNIGTFKMVANGNTAYLHSCSAYWQIVQANKEDGGYVSTEVKLGSVADFEDVPADPTAINEVQNDKPARIVVEGIYDMSGRKLDIDQSQLPEGMYIMNGKKVLNK